MTVTYMVTQNNQMRCRKNTAAKLNKNRTKLVHKKVKDEWRDRMKHDCFDFHVMWGLKQKTFPSAEHRAMFVKATFKIDTILFKDGLATYQLLRIISGLHFAILA